MTQKPNKQSNKQRRHATRLEDKKTPLQKLALRAKTLWQNHLTHRLGRIGIIPVLLVSVVACSLMIGFGGDPSVKPQATLASTKPAQKTITVSLNLIDDSTLNPSNTAFNNTSLNEQPVDHDSLSYPIEDATRYAVALDIAHLTALSDNTDNTATLTNLNNRQVEETVKTGDTLSDIFARQNISANTLYQLVNSGEEGKALTRMFPGESLTFSFDKDDQLSAITRIKNRLTQVQFTFHDEDIKTELIEREPLIRHVNRSGTISSSLSLDAFEAGLSSGITMTMANIFGGVMDFALDVRTGDQFTVIYEEHYLDGEKIADGQILAAQYVNNGKVFNAFRYEDKQGEVGYYNEFGESMRKAFLRAPVDFTRVSSGFNLKRLHPITKKVKPHRGIDYAAPVGTPIFSVGEGRVTASGYSKPNGNYVFIRHGEAYVTKYLHLHKRSVKKGQRVKQGQIIGSVGCTGYCTGPHLHYEFLVNGVHRNPRTIVSKLPKAKKLPKSKLAQFNTATQGQQDLLGHYGYQTVVAAN